MELGKLQRMKHIRRNSNRKLLIVPMDHGISMGPIKGITCMSDCIHQLSEFPINAMIMQKGMIAACSDVIGKSDIPVIMHLSAGTSLNPYGSYKVRISNVKEAVAFGCDGVSIQVEIGHEKEGDMLRDAGKIAEDCYKYGMPLMPVRVDLLLWMIRHCLKRHTPYIAVVGLLAGNGDLISISAKTIVQPSSRER